MPTTIIALPPELLYQILDDHKLQAQLAAFRLVHSSWNRALCARVLRNLDIGLHDLNITQSISSRDGRSLNVLTQASNFSSYRHYITTIHIRIGHGWDKVNQALQTEVFTIGDETNELLRRLFQSLPQLHRVDVTFIESKDYEHFSSLNTMIASIQPSFNFQFGLFIKDLEIYPSELQHLHNLHTLQVQGYAPWHNTSPYCHILAAVIQQSPDLTTLNLKDWTFPISFVMVLQSIAVMEPLKISTLKLNWNMIYYHELGILPPSHSCIAKLAHLRHLTIFGGDRHCFLDNGFWNALADHQIWLEELYVEPMCTQLLDYLASPQLSQRMTKLDLSTVWMLVDESEDRHKVLAAAEYFWTSVWPNLCPSLRELNVALHRSMHGTVEEDPVTFLASHQRWSTINAFMEFNHYIADNHLTHCETFYIINYHNMCTSAKTGDSKPYRSHIAGIMSFMAKMPFLRSFKLSLILVLQQITSQTEWLEANARIVDELKGIECQGQPGTWMEVELLSEDIDDVVRMGFIVRSNGTLKLIECEKK